MRFLDNMTPGGARGVAWFLVRVCSLACLGVLSACSAERPSSDIDSVPRGAPVIVISIDTLRADRLPAWGYRNVETPAIDALVGDGIRFASAWSHVPLTLPSHASVFTGRLPGEHGVRDNLGYRLPETLPTLSELLSENGYATAGMVSAWVLRADSGVARGFDVWDDHLVSGGGVAVGDVQRPGADTVDSALRWVDGRQSEEPFFLFLHLFEPHAPYEAAEPYRSRYRDPYDAEVAAVDAIVGRFVAELKDRGLYEGSTIILMSDHGEGLGDHGEEEHGIFLYREAIHVPLIMKLPEGLMAGIEVDLPVQLSDLFPTVLDLAGVEVSVGGDAVPLLATVAGEGGEPRRIFSESMYSRIHFGWSELTSLTNGDIHVIEAPRPELYRMSVDPAETTNLVESERRTFAEYRQSIADLSTPYAPPAPVDPEEASKLAALGYLGAGPSGSVGPLPDPKDRVHELQMMGRAWDLLQENEVEAAVELYEAVLDSNPQIADAWMQLSMAYEAAGRLRDAVRASRRAIELAPSLAAGLSFDVARLHLRLGELDDAEEHALLAEGTRPEESRILLSRISLSRGDLDEAARIARPLLASERHRAQAAVVIAQVGIRRMELQQALDLLEIERSRLIRQNRPLPSQMEFARADALIRLGRIPEGIEAFRSEIAGHPQDLHSYARLAAVHVLSGDVSSAERVIEEMVETNPGPASAAFAAETFRKLHRADLAQRWEP